MNTPKSWSVPSGRHRQDEFWWMTAGDGQRPGDEYRTMEMMLEFVTVDGVSGRRAATASPGLACLL